MSVKSIFKTLDTLDYFLKSDSTKGVSLKEICDRLGFKIKKIFSWIEIKKI